MMENGDVAADMVETFGDLVAVMEHFLVGLVMENGDVATEVMENFGLKIAGLTPLLLPFLYYLKNLLVDQ